MSTFRDVILGFADDPEWLQAATERVDAAVLNELPALAADDALRLGMRTSTASAMLTVVETLRDDLPAAEAKAPPAAVEYVRELARRGVGIDTVLRAYHAAEAAFFAELTERVGSDARMATETAIWLFAFTAALTRQIVDEYAEERERWVRSAAASRLRDVRVVLSGDAFDLAALGLRLRYSLDRRHLGLVLWADSAEGEGEPAQAVLERTAAELATGLEATGSLAVALEDGVVALWLSGVAHDSDARIRRLRLDQSLVPRPRVACGVAGDGVAGFRRSHQQALEARRVVLLSGRQSGAITRYGDVGLAALATADRAQAQEFVTRELAGLATDTDEALRLAATLRVYLEEGSSARRAAKRLGVHENTIKNRVRAAEEMVGHPATERLAELLVALRLAPLCR